MKGCFKGCFKWPAKAPPRKKRTKPKNATERNRETVWECQGKKTKAVFGKPLDTKKEPKPKLLSREIFWWGGGLPRERVGAKKLGTSLETRETQFFGRDIPGFCLDVPGAPEKFEKEKVCVQFWAPNHTQNYYRTELYYFWGFFV